jgi:hypothetical protein
VSSELLKRELLTSSIQYELKYIIIELYRLNGSDSSRRNGCDTADCSNWEIVNCVTARASGINSLYPIQREVICRALHTQQVKLF